MIKRIVTLVAIMCLFVVGLGFAVGAQTSGPSISSSGDLAGQATPAGNRALRELKRIRALAPNVDLCTTTQIEDSIADASVPRLTNCLMKLTKFAQGTQRELDALDKFVDLSFRCTNYTAVTWRGLQNGTNGYQFKLDDGTIINWTALDVAAEGEPFTSFQVVKPTDACERFSQ